MWWLFGIVLAVVLFLLLAVLATMRETVMLRGQVTALQQLIKNPPAPSYAINGTQLPAPLVNALVGPADVSSLVTSDVQLVAFVSPGCRPCETLTSGLADAVERGDVGGDSLVFIVWATDEARAAEYGSRLPGQVLLDCDADLQRIAEIRGTPTLLLVSRADNHVIDYSLEGDVAWVITQFSSRRRQLTPT